MHPVFISIPIPAFTLQLFHMLGLEILSPFHFHTYGLMAALGFLAAITIISREASRKKLDVDMVTNLVFGNILWGVVGSRLLFVMLEWPQYQDRLVAILNIREGGLVFQGGIVAAIFYSAYFVRRNSLSFWSISDVIIIGIPFGHIFGRFGCFAAGCCYGRASNLPWSVTFTDPMAAGTPLGVSLHPVQLYEAVGNMAIAVFLYYRIRKGARFEGQILLSYFILYPVLRIAVEFFRGDILRGFFLEQRLGQTISTSQAISSVELVLAVGVYFWRVRGMAGSTTRSLLPEAQGGA